MTANQTRYLKSFLLLAGSFTYKLLNQNIGRTKSRTAAWWVVLFSLVLGTSMFLFQIAVLN